MFSRTVSSSDIGANKILINVIFHVNFDGPFRKYPRLLFAYDRSRINVENLILGCLSWKSGRLVHHRLELVGFSCFLNQVSHIVDSCPDELSVIVSSNQFSINFQPAKDILQTMLEAQQNCRPENASEGKGKNTFLFQRFY